MSFDEDSVRRFGGPFSFIVCFLIFSFPKHKNKEQQKNGPSFLPRVFGFGSRSSLQSETDGDPIKENQRRRFDPMPLRRSSSIKSRPSSQAAMSTSTLTVLLTASTRASTCSLCRLLSSSARCAHLIFSSIPASMSSALACLWSEEKKKKGGSPGRTHTRVVEGDIGEEGRETRRYTEYESERRNEPKDVIFRTLPPARWLAPGETRRVKTDRSQDEMIYEEHLRTKKKKNPPRPR